METNTMVLDKDMDTRLHDEQWDVWRVVHSGFAEMIPPPVVKVAVKKLLGYRLNYHDTKTLTDYRSMDSFPKLLWLIFEAELEESQPEDHLIDLGNRMIVPATDEQSSLIHSLALAYGR